MTSPKSPKPGRPRRYDLAPAPGFAHRDAALAFAALEELTARLWDLLQDLPPEALRFVPPAGGNSIAMLTIHLAAAEARWMARVTGTALPADLEQAVTAGLQDASGALPPSNLDLAALRDTGRRVREFTRRVLAPLSDLDREVPSGKMRVSVRGVLTHLLWHWTYHTGQAGLLRRLAGPRYQWTFHPRLAGPGAG